MIRNDNFDNIQKLFCNIYEGELKSSLADIILTVDDFFDIWDPSTATPIEKVCEPLGGLC